MSDNYTVGVKVSASTEQFRQGMAIVRRDLVQTKQQFAGFGDTAADQSKKLGMVLNKADAVGKGMLVAGGVIAAGMGLAIKSFADYSTGLSEFQAASRETDQVVQQVGKSAMDIGQKFGFTAVEALDAATALNKAGVSTAEIMGGALSGALTLAATDTMAVGDAAELASIAMTQFKLGGKDVGHVADLLAAGAGKAVGSVSDLGMGLKQSGLVASQFGLSLEETVGSLAAFASQGLIGSDAGTSLKTMLLSLANPSNEAKEKMEELGIAAYDASGNFVGMDALAGQLQQSMGRLTQAERDQASALIFGNDAIRAANVLYKLGSDGVQQWEKDVNQSGYAAQVAADRLDNLNGDFQKLTTSIQNGFINAGTGANDVIRGMVQGVTNMVQWFSGLPTPVMTATLVLGGLTAAVALSGGAALIAVPKIVAYREAIATMGAVGARVDRVVGLLGKSIAGMAALGAAVVFLNALRDAARDADTSLEGMSNAILTANGLSELLAKTPVNHSPVGGIFGNVKALEADATRVRQLFEALRREQAGIFSGDFWGGESLNSAEGSAFVAWEKGVSAAAAALINGGQLTEVQKQFRELKEEANLTDEQLMAMVKDSPELTQALTNTANQAGLTSDGLNLAKIATGELLAETAGAGSKTDPLKEGLSNVEVATNKASDALDDFIEKLFAAGIMQRDLTGAELEFEAAQDDFTAGIEASIAALQGKFEAQGHSTEAAKLMAQAEWDATDKLDKSTEAGRKNWDGLIRIADAGTEYTKKLIEQSASEEDVQAAMQGTYDKLIAAVGQLGVTGDAADTLARKIAGIPPGVDIRTWMDQQAETAADRLKAKADALNGRVVSIYTRDYFTRLEQRQFLPDLNGPASGGGRPGLAAGGPVTGNGPKGVDSQWRLLAPGEHVWTDKEVDAAGGHQAVAAIRAAALQGFTTAQVAAPGASAPAAASAVSTSSTYRGDQITNNHYTIVNPVAEPPSKTLDRKSTLFALVGRPA